MDCRCKKTFLTNSDKCFSNKDVVEKGSMWEHVPYTIAGGEVRLERFSDGGLEFVEVSEDDFSRLFDDPDAKGRKVRKSANRTDGTNRSNPKSSESSKEDKGNRESRDGFCPITRKPCRKDCAWGHPILEVNDDGFSESTICAIAFIGAWCMLGIQGNTDSVYFDDGEGADSE